MKAVILAAGVGRRIAATEPGPKCLISFDGETLLERHLCALARCGITDVTLVLGYEAARVKSVLDVLDPRGEVNTLFNPDYTEGSVVSLWTARERLDAGADVLLMDADVLYVPAILERLAVTRRANCFLLDRDFEPGEEPVKLCVRDGVLVEFRKRLADDLRFDYCGESVGFFKWSADVARRLARQADRYVRGGRREEPYEEVIRDLLLETPGDFGFEDVTGLPWVEIDFPDDLARARERVLPHLRNT